ncbi:MAG: ABC transporter permease [Bacilli bacterium]|jgi:spermidine/putrescine transport system permease protein|nr:ABC transporter permease [Bacilli bacterium]
MKFKRKQLVIPYALFLFLFVIIPIALIFYYAFSDINGHLSFAALVNFFTSTTKLKVLLVSFFVGLLNTALCLIIGFPLAYFLARKKYNKNTILVMLFVMPMWINFVLRTGATRDLLDWMNLSGGKYPYLATMIGMVYNFLPFTILPLYSTMLNLDQSQIEAAADLGANPLQVFTKTIIPQTLPGLVSASTMVFMPTMSSYVIADVLSEGQISLFGSSIYLHFSNSQWNEGSFMALIMLFIVGISLLISNYFNKKKVNEKGDQGW